MAFKIRGAVAPRIFTVTGAVPVAVVTSSTLTLEAAGNISSLTDSNGFANATTTTAAAGTAVGITLLATRAGFTTVYDLTDSSGGRFSVNSSTGNVSVGLVASVAGTYFITGRGTAGGQSVTATFSIVVSSGSTAPSPYVANLWVDPVNGNDANTYDQVKAGLNTNGTQWRTPQRAMWGSTTYSAMVPIQAAKAGDTVSIAASIYTSNQAIADARDFCHFRPVNSGTSGAPIIFWVQNGIAELRATNGSGGRNGLQTSFGCTNTPYITFAGKFKSDETFTCTRQTESGPMAIWGSNNVIVDGAILIGITDPTRTSSINNHAFYLENTRSCQIRNCDISGMTDDGQNACAIEMYDCESVMIENNNLHDCANGVFFKGQHPGAPLQQGGTVRFNLIYNISIAGVQSYAIGGPGATLYTNIYQNLFIDCAYAAFWHRLVSGYTPAFINHNNNTFIRCGYGAGSNGLHSWFGNTTETPDPTTNYFNMSVHSNISYLTAVAITSQNGSSYWLDTSPISMSHNTYFGATVFAQANGNRTLSDVQTLYGKEVVGTNQVDPLFVNYAGGDFHLQAGSTMRNSGLNGITRGCYITGNEIIGVTP